MGPRIMAANRVAQNASEWASQVAQSNSGTGNKQWLVVQSGESHVKLWVVEQLPSVTQAADQTARLNTTGYWASYGLPYYKVQKHILFNMTLSYYSCMRLGYSEQFRPRKTDSSPSEAKIYNFETYILRRPIKRRA